MTETTYQIAISKWRPSNCTENEKLLVANYNYVHVLHFSSPKQETKDAEPRRKIKMNYSLIGLKNQLKWATPPCFLSCSPSY